MDVHVEIAAETLFHVGPIPVTNSMLQMFLIMGLLLFVGNRIARNAKLIPGRAQRAVEAVLEFLLGMVEATAGKKFGRRIFPLISALFFFIIIANWSGMLPGVGSIGYYHEEAHSSETTHSEEEAQPGTTDDEHTEESGVIRVFEVASAGPVSVQGGGSHAEAGEKVLIPFFRAPNADINMTLAMALITFTVVQVAGVRMHGVGGRIKHMANPPFLFPIEVISEFSRIISLSARLFGNVFAGEVLLAVMYSMAAAIKIAIVPFLFPVVFLFLELLFGAIQALVFALLTLIYIALAAEGGHDEEHAHGHAPAHGAVPASGHAD
jgi:F-type H+-transporting ATPase subunit a